MSLLILSLLIDIKTIDLNAYFFCSSHEFLLLDSFILIYWSLELIDVDGKAMTSKNLGIVLFILVLFSWIMVPILPFFNFPYKGFIIVFLFVVGEIFFVISISLLGKEYWSLVKDKVKKFIKK